MSNLKNGSGSGIRDLLENPRVQEGMSKIGKAWSLFEEAFSEPNAFLDPRRDEDDRREALGERVTVEGKANASPVQEPVTARERMRKAVTPYPGPVATVNEGAKKFCEECGEAVAKKFCGGCGAKVGA